MLREKLGMRGGLFVWAILLATCGILIGFEGCISRRPSPSVVVVDASQSVVLLEPNKVFMAKHKSAVLSLGYYMKLSELENDVAAGRLKRIEP